MENLSSLRRIAESMRRIQTIINNEIELRFEKMGEMK